MVRLSEITQSLYPEKDHYDRFTILEPPPLLLDEAAAEKKKEPQTYRSPDEEEIEEFPKGFLRLKTVLYWITFSICCTLCAYNLMLVFVRYFEKQSTIHTSVERLRSILDVLPGITICSNSLITVDELLGKDEKLKQSWKAFDKLAAANYTEDAIYRERMHFLDKLLDERFGGKSISEYFKSPLVTAPYDEEKSEGTPFIVGTSSECDLATWKKSASFYYDLRTTCPNVYRVRHLQNDTSCVTLFHEAALIVTNETAIRFMKEKFPDFPVQGRFGLDEEYTLDKEELSQRLNKLFEPYIFPDNGVFTMKVNLNCGNLWKRKNQMTNLRKPLGGKIIVHPKTHIPSTLMEGFYLKPGTRYTFYLTKQKTRNLKQPYKTNCTDYIGKYMEVLADYKRKGLWTQIDLRVPLSAEACLDLCLEKKAVQECKCWPRILPFRRDNLTEGAESVKWCSEDDSEKCMNTYTNPCIEQCPRSCQEDFFTVDLKESPYPPPEDVEKLKNEESPRSYHRKYNPSEIIIDIIYTSKDETVSVYSPKVTFIDLFCNIAGILELFTGLCFVSLIDLGYYLFDKYSQKREKKV